MSWMKGVVMITASEAKERSEISRESQISISDDTITDDISAEPYVEELVTSCVKDILEKIEEAIKLGENSATYTQVKHSSKITPIDTYVSSEIFRRLENNGFIVEIEVVNNKQCDEFRYDGYSVLIFIGWDV